MLKLGTSVMNDLVPILASERLQSSHSALPSFVISAHQSDWVSSRFNQLSSITLGTFWPFILLYVVQVWPWQIPNVLKKHVDMNFRNANSFSGLTNNAGPTSKRRRLQTAGNLGPDFKFRNFGDFGSISSTNLLYLQAVGNVGADFKN